jgi:hypothetical protein
MLAGNYPQLHRCHKLYRLMALMCPGLCTPAPVRNVLCCQSSTPLAVLSPYCAARTNYPTALARELQRCNDCDNACVRRVKAKSITYCACAQQQCAHQDLYTHLCQLIQSSFIRHGHKGASLGTSSCSSKPHKCHVSTHHQHAANLPTLKHSTCKHNPLWSLAV